MPNSRTRDGLDPTSDESRYQPSEVENDLSVSEEEVEVYGGDMESGDAVEVPNEPEARRGIFLEELSAMFDNIDDYVDDAMDEIIDKEGLAGKVDNNRAKKVAKEARGEAEKAKEDADARLARLAEKSGVPVNELEKRAEFSKYYEREKTRISLQEQVSKYIDMRNGGVRKEKLRSKEGHIKGLMKELGVSGSELEERFKQEISREEKMTNLEVRLGGDMVEVEVTDETEETIKIPEKIKVGEKTLEFDEKIGKGGMSLALSYVDEGGESYVVSISRNLSKEFSNEESNFVFSSLLSEAYGWEKYHHEDDFLDLEACFSINEEGNIDDQIHRNRTDLLQGANHYREEHGGNFEESRVVVIMERGGENLENQARKSLSYRDGKRAEEVKKKRAEDFRNIEGFNSKDLFKLNTAPDEISWLNEKLNEDEIDELQLEASLREGNNYNLLIEKIANREFNHFSSDFRDFIEKVRKGREQLSILHKEGDGNFDNKPENRFGEKQGDLGSMESGADLPLSGTITYNIRPSCLEKGALSKGGNYHAYTPRDGESKELEYKRKAENARIDDVRSEILQSFEYISEDLNLEKLPPAAGISEEDVIDAHAKAMELEPRDLELEEAEQEIVMNLLCREELLDLNETYFSAWFDGSREDILDVVPDMEELTKAEEDLITDLEENPEKVKALRMVMEFVGKPGGKFKELVTTDNEGNTAPSKKWQELVDYIQFVLNRDKEIVENLPTKEVLKNN